MPWFRVDDNADQHPKMIAAGNAALGLWLRCGAWSMRLLTDGWIPGHIARQYGTPAQARRLCDVGLWQPKDDGYIFHEWADHNPSRVQVQADREEVSRLRKVSAAYGNHIRWHVKRGLFDPDCSYCKDGT